MKVETSIADVGERKAMFGQHARRVMTVIDRQPQPGACDQVKQRMETDAPVSNTRELAESVSDAHEVELAAGPRADLSRRSGDAAKAGVARVCVPELANKTTQNVNTRALRTQLIAELAEQKMEGVALAAATQDELNAYANDIGCDFLLIAQITELKASKPGRIGRMIKATAGEAAKDVTEAKLTMQLVPVGGVKPRLSTNTSGNDGGIGFKTGLRLARVAAMLYLRYASPIGALNAMQIMNMGGLGGFLGNPVLMQMQTGLGVTGIGGGGVDRTAGAAMFLMEQAMAGASAGTQDGPSFDASLAEALQEGAKKVAENLKR